MEEDKIGPATGLAETTIRHIYQNARYRVVIERAASTKGILGYKVEANGDDLFQVIGEAELLKSGAERMTATEVPHEG